MSIINVDSSYIVSSRAMSPQNTYITDILHTITINSNRGQHCQKINYNCSLPGQNTQTFSSETDLFLCYFDV